MLPKVQDSTNAFTMWGNLLKMHEILNEDRAFFIENMLFSIQMEDFDIFPNHLLKIWDIRDQLKSIDRTMKEEKMVVITLKSLPSSNANFVKTLNITSTDIV